MKSDILVHHNEFPQEMFQVINENGDIVDDESLKLIDDEMLVKMYEWMIRIRIADTRANNLQRVGRMGTYPSVYGQEACQVGPGLALQKEDWLVPTFRETGTMWCFGVPLTKTYLYWMGNEIGSQMPEGVNCLPIAITVGGHLPHATGIAWANRLQNKKSAVLCSFSDGASSEGDFHAALNFASVFDAPAVFFMQNNHYAISTHSIKQTKSKTFAQKAFGYGMPAILVDGNDPIATYIACKTALDYARENNRPVLIEAVTYRLGNHTSSDNAKLYREDSEVDEWKPKEPMIRTRKLLEAKGLWDDAKEDAAVKAAKAEVDEIAKEALATKKLNPLKMFDQLYAELTPELKRQRDELEAELKAAGSDRLS